MGQGLLALMSTYMFSRIRFETSSCFINILEWKHLPQRCSFDCW